jgi:hypothetical protein
MLRDGRTASITKAKNEMEGGLLLGIVVRKGTTVLECHVSEQKFRVGSPRRVVAARRRGRITSLEKRRLETGSDDKRDVVIHTYHGTRYTRAPLAVAHWVVGRNLEETESVNKGC